MANQKNYTFAALINNIVVLTKLNKKMKKLFALLMIAGMFSFVACAPKQEEKATEPTTEQPAAEQAAVVDSAAQAAPTAAADSSVQK